MIGLFALLCVLPTAFAQTLTRGPYLQLPTPGNVTVRWRTDQATDSVVRYGTSLSSYPFTALSASQTTEHKVSVSGLQPDTRYYYTVGTSSASLAGGDTSYSFVTPPAAGIDKATRIWITGDAGTADANAVSVRDAYKAFTGTRPTDLWLTLGDIAYNDGTDLEYQAAFFDMYPRLLRQMPVWPTYGNHDGHSASAATQTGPYFDIFTLPTAAEAGGVASQTEAYYSFDYGIVHFISLDSFESNRTSSGSMIPWLLDDLSANDKEWTIAFWHHPPFSKGSHDSDVELELVEMRENAAALLESYGVDLVLTGHSHSYERSFLLDGHYGNSTTLTPAMILDSGSGREDGSGAYIKPGMAGTPNEGAVYTVAGSSGKITSSPLNHPAMYTSLLSLGSLVLDIAGNRLEAKFLDSSGTVLDHFTVIKGNDSFTPTIVLAEALTDTTLSVLYSEPVEPLSAEALINYDIAGVAIAQASLQADQRTVELTTAAMATGTGYVLTVNNVEDIAGNLILANTQVPFEIDNRVSQAFQNGVSPSPGYLGTRDAYLSEAQPDTNAGSDTSLLVDGDDPRSSGLDKATLIAWDVSAIPPGSAVEAVSVTIEVTSKTQDLYSFVEMRRSWLAQEATWNQYASGMAWGIPGAQGGADRGSTVLGTATAVTTGTRTITLNADGVALVQSWVDDASQNNGLILSDTAAGDGLDFWSSDAPVLASRPQLIVDYRSPQVLSDFDNDGIPDVSDNCITTPNGPLIPDPEGGASQQDDDGDGIGNACDLLVTTTSLPSAKAGQFYAQQLTAVRGQSPYTWSLIGGALPADLSLSTSGRISGKVSSASLASFTVQVTDSTGHTAAKNLQISVAFPTCYACHAAVN